MLGASLTAIASGCIGLPNPMGKAQEAAQDFNESARYGKDQVEIERVAPTEREAYLSHHSAWGSKVQIADIELERLHPKGEHEAEVTVRVQWYRPDEQDLHSTTLKQTWRDQKGWRLTAEERIDGDIGLLGEAVVLQAPHDPRLTPQFPTIRLQGE